MPSVVQFGIVDWVGLCSRIHPNFAGILVVFLVAELFACVVVMVCESR